MTTCVCYGNGPANAIALVKTHGNSGSILFHSKEQIGHYTEQSLGRRLSYDVYDNNGILRGSVRQESDYDANSFALFLDDQKVAYAVDAKVYEIDGTYTGEKPRVS